VYSDVAEKNQESLLKTINELDQKNNELLGDNVKLKEKMKHLNEELLQYQTSRRVGYSS
jgi:chromosome segregation ATPase